MFIEKLIICLYSKNSEIVYDVNIKFSLMNKSDKLKIVVVTGSDFLNETFKKFLTNRVIEVYCCPDGLQCIKHSVESSPSLIFIDVNLNGFHCIDTLKVLNSFNILKQVPTVIMLSPAQNNILPEFIDMGISTLLYKPFNRIEVLNLVNGLISEEIKKKTDALPVMEAVVVNAEMNKTNSSAKAEQMNKILMLKAFSQNVKTWEKNLLLLRASKDSEGFVRKLTIIKEAANGIGYPRVLLICDYLIKKFAYSSEPYDWKEITKYTDEMISLFSQIVAHQERLSA